jgi:hypothetical protein
VHINAVLQMLATVKPLVYMMGDAIAAAKAAAKTAGADDARGLRLLVQVHATLSRIPMGVGEAPLSTLLPNSFKP